MRTHNAISRLEVGEVAPQDVPTAGGKSEVELCGDISIASNCYFLHEHWTGLALRLLDMQDVHCAVNPLCQAFVIRCRDKLTRAILLQKRWIVLRSFIIGGFYVMQEREFVADTEPRLLPLHPAEH